MKKLSIGMAFLLILSLLPAHEKRARKRALLSIVL